MSMIDGSAVNVALPRIARDLHATSSELQWIVEGYALLLSAFMLIGGSIGDIYGRRKIFAIGVALFALGSLGCALAPSAISLVAWRCVQGCGGALVTPGSLAIISASFTGEARGRAIGTWSGFAAITSAAGPVIGGWLVQHESWRAIFLINLPVAAVALVALFAGVAESRDGAAGSHVDWQGGLLASVGLGTVVYGLIEAQAHLASGWSAAFALGTIAFGCAVLGWFVRNERRVAAPMLPLGLFANRTFAVTNIYTLLLYAGIGGSFYFIPFDLINVQHYSATQAGAALLPIVAIIFLGSRWSGGLVVSYGAKGPLVGGACIAAVGFAWFGLAGVGRPYALTFLPAAIVFGVGAALFVAPLTTAVMGSVDEARAGIASGVNNTISRAAGLLAIALLGIVVSVTFSGSLAHRLRSEAISPATRAAASVAGERLVTGVLPAAVRDPRQIALLGRAVAASYADGFGASMFASAALALLAAGLVFFGLPAAGESRARSAHAQHDRPPA